MISEHQLVLEARFVDPDDIHEKRIGIDDGIIREISSSAKGRRVLHLENYLTFPDFSTNCTEQ